MSDYRAPIRDINFVLEQIAGINGLSELPGFEEATPELVAAVVDEAARLSSEVVAPTNQPADRQGARIVDDGVVQADGLGAVYQQLIDGGWISLPFSPDWGGQGLPAVLALAVQEMLMSANLGFSLCPMLTYGAIEAIDAHGNESLKQSYLPKMVSGGWTGTMNLTEPQAGSDLAAVSTKAEPQGDHYVITGQKIFISWGDHDMTENIVHLVLARLPDAPPGVKGVSLFLVPKFLVNEDGSLGERNDVYAVSLEHKLGIHASPTCVLSFGENSGAVGYLIGEPNDGLACMFTMMNHARLSVGLQGVGVAERSYQQAVAYANEREQGMAVGINGRTPIIHHPDVRRMLMLMKSLTEAARALAYVAMGSLDYAHASTDVKARAHHQARVDLLTPVVKGWCTEVAQEITSLGLQVHGGMGFVEETGAAQHFRDARILPIYEGTNGVQALDLVNRKFLRDGGKAMSTLVQDIEALVTLLNGYVELREIADRLGEAVGVLKEANTWVQTHSDAEGVEPGSVAFNYLMLVGTVVGGWLLAKEALAAFSGRATDAANADFYSAKITTAGFYFQHVAPRAGSYLRTVQAGSDTVMALHNEHFCL
jgi:alkylation response protein AidB-like acyl-CoA dehydrogenase